MQVIWGVEDIMKILITFTAIVIIAVLYFRNKRNETEKRTQIILSALEKNSDSVPEELLHSLNAPQKSIKERLLGKLLWGCLLGLSGLGIIIAEMVMYFSAGKYFEDEGVLLVLGAVLLATGVAFLIYYFVGRRALHHEIETFRRSYIHKSPHKQAINDLWIVSE